MKKVNKKNKNPDVKRTPLRQLVLRQPCRPRQRVIGLELIHFQVRHAAWLLGWSVCVCVCARSYVNTAPLIFGFKPS